MHLNITHFTCFKKNSECASNFSGRQKHFKNSKKHNLGIL